MVRSLPVRMELGTIIDLALLGVFAIFLLTAVIAFFDGFIESVMKLCHIFRSLLHDAPCHRCDFCAHKCRLRADCTFCCRKETRHLRTNLPNGVLRAFQYAFSEDRLEVDAFHLAFQIQFRCLNCQILIECIDFLRVLFCLLGIAFS